MKRYLPLISILVVSFFVFLCALGAVYVLSVDAHTAEEKMQALLTLGIPSALALLVLLWFGAGMDWVLSRLKQRSTRIGVSLLTYIVVPIFLCIGLPALVAFLIYGAFTMPSGWKEMPKPPAPAVEVTQPEWYAVTIRADDGSYYFCEVNTPAECWQSTSKPERTLITNETDTAPYPAAPEGAVSVKGVSYQDGGEEARTYFAVLEDGSVWVLQNEANTYEAGFATGLFLTIAIIPAIAGLLVIYLGAGISAIARGIANRS
jgi:hypothetical protein